MKIINQNAVLLDRTANNAYTIVEQCGRTCYKSEDKMTDGSALRFCKAMLKNMHHAMLEHAVTYVITDSNIGDKFMDYMRYLKTYTEQDSVTPYVNVSVIVNENRTYRYVISMSFRTVVMLIESLRREAGNIDQNIVNNVICLIQNIADKYSDLFNNDVLGADITDKFTESNITDACICVCNDSQFKEYADTLDEKTRDKILRKHLVHTVIFTTNRGVTHELVRHRPASFAQESTRYCDYNNGKFGGELTVIRPCYYADKPELMILWQKNAEAEERIYMGMRQAGAAPQEARGNLLHDIKADLVVTASEAEWQHIINLRYHGTTGAPHPQAKEAMGIAYPLLVNASNGRIR